MAVKDIPSTAQERYSYTTVSATTPVSIVGAYPKLTLHPNEFEVCEAVKLLCTRMGSNIKDFYLTGEKTIFGDITYAVRARILDPEKNKDKLFILNDTEIDAYWKTYIRESKKELHNEVMSRILKSNEES